jgi:hypothetical protein
MVVILCSDITGSAALASSIRRGLLSRDASNVCRCSFDGLILSPHVHHFAIIEFSVSVEYFLPYCKCKKFSCHTFMQQH